MNENYLGPLVENGSFEHFLGDGHPPVEFKFPGHFRWERRTD